jgi:hypothetical protein
MGHYKDRIEACKGGILCGSNFDWAGPLAEVVLLGNEALRLKMRDELTGRKLLWDGPAMRLTTPTLQTHSCAASTVKAGQSSPLAGNGISPTRPTLKKNRSLTITFW